MRIGDPHRHHGDPAEDLSILGITDVPDRHLRLWAGDEQQVVALEFAPAAGITIIPKLREIHGAIMLGCPYALADLRLTCVDLYK